MTDCSSQDPRAIGGSLQDAVKRMELKVGSVALTDDDVVLLACAEMARTYTRDEKGYA